MFRNVMKSWHKFWGLNVNYQLDMTNDFIDTEKYIGKIKWNEKKH
jgi:hypothetical protein